MHRRELLRACLLGIIAGCRRAPRERAIGEAYVLAWRLPVWKELGQSEPVVATAARGQRLEVLARRRRFARVRTASGAIGWVEGDRLGSREEAERLNAFDRWAASLPSQGKATVSQPLNIHAEPDRGSLVVEQILADVAVDVVGHRLIEGNGRVEDWALVVHPEGVAGWVLTRRLFMAIPDEVAQYAEGARIMAYFPLGEESRGEQVRHHWLWATIGRGGQPYEFDCVRLFLWNQRRRRYETAFLRRGIKGFYPIEVARAGEGQFRFSFISEERDGAYLRYTYSFDGRQVRLASKVPVNGPPALQPPAPPSSSASSGGSFWRDLRRQLFGWVSRW